MQKKCRQCFSDFEIPQSHLDFLRRVSPAFGNQGTFEIPPPTLCPDCRLQRRLAFRNPIHVGWRDSKASGKKVLSAYVGSSRADIVENDIWWGDSWDGLQFGRAFDQQSCFFEQFEKLRAVIPYAAMLAFSTQNSAYCSNVSDIKNCYLVFNSKHTEDCYVCDFVWGSRDCLDCTRTIDSELCYDCVECFRCYNLQSSEYCDDCLDSFFLSHCRVCRNCFGCVNLRHKEFYFFNQACTRQQYEEKIRQYDLCSWKTRQELYERLNELGRGEPRPHIYGLRLDNVTGNYVRSGRNLESCFFVEEAEDCAFCFTIPGSSKNCLDYSHWGYGAELVYESQSCGDHVFNLRFCRDCWEGNSNLLYCASCFGCQDCFGCVGLRKKRYCVLNQQLSADEYNQLAPKIVRHMIKHGEWGEFFPMSTSPFPYNLSFAQRYFPLEQEQCVARGLTWFKKESVVAENVMRAQEIPDHLPPDDTPLVICSVKSGRNFNVSAEELKRLRRFGAALPRLAYDERMEQRFIRLHGIHLYERRCDKTGRSLKTVHPPSARYPVWDREEYIALYDQ